MKAMDVFVSKEAVDDLNEGRSFYDLQASGVGDYFWDCLIADIESLKQFLECFHVFGGRHGEGVQLKG